VLGTVTSDTSSAPVCHVGEGGGDVARRGGKLFTTTETVLMGFAVKGYLKK